jgi:hypothetical protein
LVVEGTKAGPGGQAGWGQRWKGGRTGLIKASERSDKGGTRLLPVGKEWEMRTVVLAPH